MLNKILILLKLLFLATSIVNASPNSLLHEAAKNCRVRDIQKALEQGADVDAYSADDEWGFTPLHAAVGSHCFRAVYYLVEWGNAEVNILDDFERTPLHVAALMKNRKIFSFLLRAGADRFALDYDDRTPEEIFYSPNTIPSFF